MSTALAAKQYYQLRTQFMVTIVSAVNSLSMDKPIKSALLLLFLSCLQSIALGQNTANSSNRVGGLGVGTFVLLFFAGFAVLLFLIGRSIEKTMYVQPLEDFSTDSLTKHFFSPLTTVGIALFGIVFVFLVVAPKESSSEAAESVDMVRYI